MRIFDMVEMVKKGAVEPIDEVQEGQWKTIGTATLEDAWITPSYPDANKDQLIPSENLIKAELQQDVKNENRYRLWRPFHDTNWAPVIYNMSNFDGQIVFDITDPEHVIVEAGMPAGFKNSNGDFYVYGMLGWQISGYGDAYDADLHLQGILDLMIEKGQPFDTYADGVVSVNRSVFDFSKRLEHAYTWNNNEYIVSKIYFPSDLSAIGNVESDTENAPVEYFNLQGMKLENPAQGQIVIRRQGSKVTKEYIK